MNIRKILLTLSFSLFVCFLSAQTKKITIDTSTTLREIAKNIESQCDYSFVYTENIDMDQSKKVLLKNMALEESLNNIFDKTGILWRISDKYIILYNSKYITISGYVTDGKSQETLIDAPIQDKNSRNGSFSNSYGFYTIQVAPGTIEMQASYIGYAPSIKKFEAKKDTVVNFPLAISEIYLKDIVIQNTKSFSPSSGSVEFTGSTIKSMPASFAESDVLKSLQFIPGIQSGVEGSAGIYVRGGGPDQNLILIDDVPVYNTGHAFGLFSVFNGDAIKKVSVHKGSFPARYGGRLSSVIDIRFRDGDMQNYHASASIGLLAARVNIEGPIIKGKTSFNFSARRSYIDGFLRIARSFTDENVPVFYIYDVNAKINHKFSDRSRLYLSFYEGRDALNTGLKGRDYNNKRYDLTKLEYKWGNTIASLRWNYIFNSNLFMNATVAYNRYKFNFESRSENRSEYINSIYSNFQYSGINDWQFSADWQYSPNNKHHIRFGSSFIMHKFSPEVNGSHSKETDKEEHKNKTNYYLFNINRGKEMSLYAEDEFPITEKFKTNLGVHFSLINTEGKTYKSLQPRASFGYELSSKLAVKTSYTKMNQYVNLLTSNATSQPTDLWVPITRNLEPMSSHQFTLGAFWDSQSGYSFSVEGFYKKMNNVLEYKDGSSWKDAYISWESQVEAGKGWGYGVELFAQKKTGRFVGWIGYTLAWNDRQFKTINYGKRFPAKYDRRHDFNITGTYKLNSKVDFSASWMYATGNNTTLALEEYQVLPHPDLGSYWYETVPYVKQRNNYRLSPTHHLDVDMKYYYSPKKMWTFSIYNIYNRQNTYLAEPGYSKKDKGKQVVYEYNFLGIVPSISFTYKFR
ncbi:MAG: TonB-dependent receptor [Prevotella sp.]|jgi:hypothetical protein|nr:TonB-dependent receptor [Prevotella sp.]